MPIQPHRGDLLDVRHGIIVHGCNQRGVMGAGVALALRTRYPQVWEHYARVHAERGLVLGEVLVVDVAPHAPRTLLVANAITQADFGRSAHRVYVDYDALERCFQRVRTIAVKYALPVHFPLIGCGLAGGRWAEVSARIERALGETVDAHLWVPPGQALPV